MRRRKYRKNMVWREGRSQKIAEGGLEMFQEKRSLDKKRWVGGNVMALHETI